MNSQPGKNGLSSVYKSFNCLFHANVPSVKPKHKPSTTKTAFESVIQNRLPTLKPGDTTKIKIDKENIWDKKGSVIARNYCPHSYKVLNKKSNLIIRSRLHLIPTTEKFIVKHDYKNIIEPSKTTS